MSSYKDVVAWQKGMELADATYKAVRALPKSERFVLSAQMRAAAVSIPSNIAEGKGRGTDRDYRYFVIRARGSTLELETQVELARRLQLFDVRTSEALLRLTEQVGRTINGLIAYLDDCIARNA